ncbi:GDP/GTP exchange factor for ARF [Malassezia cuniculi]|uniref:GDP/GTP exchange factor for ARF n=1 Tax=Malassezia cuniculi TaxID=948313 RepID=A0AAF0EV65_9BASI|nr:GDP/GTP exchange factor for ARF [Malassezia cuniculi]
MRSSPRWSLAALASASPLGSVTASTSAMSLTKEAHAIVSGDDDAPAVGLLGGFTVLRAQLRQATSLRDIPLRAIVTHFLRVILSERTTGTVTRTALEAIQSFLDHGLFALHSVGLARTVQDVAHATSHCRFEPSDSSMDEVVLLAILDVMHTLVCGHVGAPDAPMLVDLLSDESVCEMMETGLSMCCQTRLSTTLRRAAEKTVQRMFCTLFDRLDQLSLDDAASMAGEEPEHATLVAELDDGDKGLRMATPNPQSNQFPGAGLSDAGDAEADAEAGASTRSDLLDASAKPAGDAGDSVDAVDASNASPSPSTAREGAAEQPAKSALLTDTPDIDRAPPAEASDAPPSEPFGLAALVEVLRVLVALLDPRSTRHTNTMRLLGLNILSTLLEVHGASIARFPSLRAMIEDSALRHMMQLSSSENSVVVARALRVLSVTFDCMRTELKMQQELVLRFFIQQLQPAAPIAATPWAADEKPTPAPPLLTWVDGGASGEIRVLLLEAFCLFCDAPGDSSDVFVNLWRNYDCDMSCGNMYDELVHFLCRTIISQPLAPSATRQFSGLQLVATDLVLSFVNRMAQRLDAPVSADDAALRDKLHSQHERKALLARCAAEFNRKPAAGIASLEAAGLVDVNARANSIARFLKESADVDKRLLGDYLSRPDNIAILAAFIDLFNFHGIDVADAMRALCEAFRLPGEAQQIARITETFARAYYASSPPGIRSEDAVYVLAYSVIMLNTDLHNPQVTRRMSIADYQRNLRGVNDGEDFDPAYLAQLYDSIRRREIVMPEEHAGELGFSYAWKELLRRSRTAGQVIETETAAFDRDLFRTSWKPLVAAIVHAFAELSDEHMLQRTIAACRQCAALADAHGVPQVLDYMVQHFAIATGLVDAPNARGAPTAVREVQGAQVTVTPLSIQFGADFKGQLAAVVLFTIANGSGNAIRGGWRVLYAVLESLLSTGLLPPAVASRQVAKGGKFVRAPITLRVRGASQASTPSGLFGTLSSYFLSPYASGEAQLDVSESDVENTLSTLDCLASCRLDEIDAQCTSLAGEARDASFEALAQRLEKHLSATEDPAYDPSAVFLLDRLASAATSRAFDVHLEFLSKTPSRHALLLEAALTGALRIATAHGSVAELAKVLALAAELPADTHTTIAAAILDGTWAFFNAHSHKVEGEANWALVTRIIAAFSRVRRADAVRAYCGLCAYLIENEANSHNYAVLVERLREIALAVDRMLWRSAAESAGGPRRTLTEKREQSDWEAAVREQSAVAVDALQKSVRGVSGLVTSDSWPTYWLPLLAALAQQCVNAYRPTRNAATTALERVIMSQELMEPAPKPVLGSVALVFENILFPLMDTLMRPEAQRADQLEGGGEGDSTVRTRERVCLVIGKAWLRFAGALIGDARDADSERFIKLWKGVLAAYVRVLRGPHGETVVEQLKNVLLVMHSAASVPDSADAFSTQASAAASAAAAAATAAAPAASSDAVPADAATAPAPPNDKLVAGALSIAWAAIEPVIPGLQTELFPQQ